MILLLLFVTAVLAVVVMRLGRENLTDEQRKKNRQWGRKHGDQKWGRKKGFKKWKKWNKWKSVKPTIMAGLKLAEKIKDIKANSSSSSTSSNSDSSSTSSSSDSSSTSSSSDSSSTSSSGESSSSTPSSTTPDGRARLPTVAPPDESGKWKWVGTRWIKNTNNTSKPLSMTPPITEQVPPSNDYIWTGRQWQVVTVKP